mgnify:CR=1 FL=1
MGTLVYSPAVSILIDTASRGTIDVSDDIISGDLVLNQDAPHNLSVRLENPRRKYDGLFMPNDRVVVRLKRLRWLQVFAGYLNSVPFASVWPRAVDISASCTLKRLINTFYDPGAIETANLMAQFATSSAVRGSTPQAGTQSADGNLSERAKVMLTEIVQWEAEKIHIGRLPPDWWEKVSGLYEKISPELVAAVANHVDPGATMSGAALGALDADGDKTLTAAEIAQLLYATGWRGEDLIHMGGIVWRESKFHIDAYNNQAAGNGDHACGLFQMLWPLHGFDKTRMLSDPVYAAQQAFALYSSNGFTPWKGGPGEANPTVVAEGERMIREAIANMPSTTAGSATGGGASTGTAASPWGAISAAVSTALSSATGGVSAQVAGAPAKLVFPVPGAGRETTTENGVMWGYTDDWGQPRSGGRTHKGHDIFAAKGTPILSMCDGVVDRTKDIDDGLSGIYVRIKDSLGNLYYYIHNETNLVSEGDLVTAGQQIAIVDNTGNAKNTASHCHFEWHPGGGDAVNPHTLLNAAARIDVPTAGGTTGPMLGSTSFPTPDQVSALLIGPRMLMNDTPIFGPIKELVGASMRSFCSAPNGDFIAWFPDYFGQYGLTAAMTIEPIELIDFTIDWDDTRLVTHQFVTGSVGGFQSTIPEDPNDTLALMTQTMGVASLDFPEILEAIIGDNAGDWTNPRQLLQRFGARPDLTHYPAIISGQGEFFMAVHLFKASWARQFTANTSISFMPELYPGMIAKIPSQGLQVYVEQVSHSWDFRQGGGFDTRIQVSSPASLNGRFAALPQAENFASGGGRIATGPDPRTNPNRAGQARTDA